MKKIISISIICLLFFSGCQDFLDSESYVKKNDGNFPRTVADAEQMLTGMYSTFSQMISQSQHTHFMMAELASDDRFGGGGENDKDFQALDRLMNSQPDRFVSFWEASYAGILRTNKMFETIDQCSGWASEDQKNQYLGEAYFLRGLFYFQLSQMFGEVPLKVKSGNENLPKSPAEDTYAQIASDLKQAITLMGSGDYTTVKSGHATKWAAEALMARVFLFYTGYYGKSSLPLAGETVGSISKTEVIAWLDDCIANSGHGLVSDFRNLWPYTNEYTAKNYSYATTNGLKWEGDGNKETVFAIKFGTKVDWGYDFSLGYSNQYLLCFGLRSSNGREDTFPFGVGWGAGPVNSNLWKEWLTAEPNDIRRTGSIMNVETDLKAYTWGGDKQMEETGFWQKKYIPITAYGADGKFKVSYAILSDGAKDEYQLAHTQDLVLIRFADVLLMHSELKEDAVGLNKVRARAGLPAVGYSLDAIKKERRWELSFEGLRYFDIMRWGDAADLLAKQEGVAIKNRGIDTSMKRFSTGYKARYEATGGFWPIPESQVNLSAGVLKQNKGWGTPDADYIGW